MKKVFFGGSRRLGKLNKAVLERVDNIIASGYLVLVGDANGADLAMQKYLAEKSYKNVLIFCAGNSCRNNVGGWEKRLVKADRTKKDFQYYAIRDETMSDEADYGFMAWDGKSKGTLNNIINLLVRKKLVMVHLSTTGKFVTLRSESDLPKLLSSCTRSDLEHLEKALRINQRIHPEQAPLNFSFNKAGPISSPYK